MPLDEHQIEHLDAIIKDAQDDLLESGSRRQKIAAARGVDEVQLAAELNRVANAALAIKLSGNMPKDIIRASDLHDQLEKNGG